MKTRALALLLTAGVAVGACSSRQTPPPPGPQAPTGPATAQPPPNPNPEPPIPPVATPAAVVAPASKSTAAAVPLAEAVPDQPVIAAAAVAPAPAVRPHRTILEMKKMGTSDEVILEKVRADNVNYQLTTAEIVELKGAGLSQVVLEAMLRSGQPQPSARK